MHTANISIPEGMPPGTGMSPGAKDLIEMRHELQALQALPHHPRTYERPFFHARYHLEAEIRAQAAYLIRQGL